MGGATGTEGLAAFLKDYPVLVTLVAGLLLGLLKRNFLDPLTAAREEIKVLKQELADERREKERYRDDAFALMRQQAMGYREREHDRPPPRH